MTPEQLRQNAAAMIAFADGKPIQCRAVDETWSWKDLPQPSRSDDCPSWDFMNLHYRPKPEPVTRPWSKPEDVPLNCWLRDPSHPDAVHFIVVCICPGSISVSDSHGGHRFTWADLQRIGIQHSTDRKSWLPCTVTQ